MWIDKQLLLISTEKPIANIILGKSNKTAPKGDFDRPLLLENEY